jgi:protein required for attachment to host cells
MLDHSYELGEFGNLVIVAPKRSLGEFHKLATEKLRRSVSREVAKDLVKLSDHELERRLRPYLDEVP